MTRTEHLLAILAEECAEVAQRATKALRFGVSEVQGGQSLTNAERIAAEAADLVAVMEMLEDECHVTLFPNTRSGLLAAKKRKVETFLAYSEGLGTLS